ncbi:MAG: sugar transferase [Desulfosporosinus sp.]|nr:sugar transferase [Desulfosporosinus sp.]
MLFSAWIARLRKWYMASDAAAFILATVGVGLTKFGLNYSTIDVRPYLVMLLFLSLEMGVLLHFAGVYELEALLQRSTTDYFKAIFYGAVSFYILSFYIRYVSFSRIYFTTIFGINFLLAVGFRSLLIKRNWRVYGDKMRLPLVAIGLDQAPSDLVRRVRQEAGLRILAEIASDKLQGLEVEGSGWTEFEAALAQENEDVRIRNPLARGRTEGSDKSRKATEDQHTVGVLLYESPLLPIRKIVEHCELNYIPVFLVPSANGLLSVPFRALDRQDVLIFGSKDLLIDGLAKRLKRLNDVVFACGALLLSFWLMGLLWLLVYCTSPGTGFFAHERLGLDGRRIRIYKFRTMYQNADERLAWLLDDPTIRQEWESNYKLAEDPRITPVGRLLRRTSLDELPQLWNILRGDICLVGPRPIIPEELERYGAQAKLILRVKPGLTGLWQVSGRNDVSYEERIRLDLYYIYNWSLTMDLRIVLQTVPVVLTRKGAV